MTSIMKSSQIFINASSSNKSEIPVLIPKKDEKIFATTANMRTLMLKGGDEEEEKWFGRPLDLRVAPMGAVGLQRMLDGMTVCELLHGPAWEVGEEGREDEERKKKKEDYKGKMKSHL